MNPQTTNTIFLWASLILAICFGVSFVVSVI